MRTLMLVQIDEFTRAFYNQERSFKNRSRFTDHGYYRSVVVGVMLPVEKCRAGCRANLVEDILDYINPSTLGYIRNTFNQFRHQFPRVVA
jgi:hypothetical protein